MLPPWRPTVHRSVSSCKRTLVVAGTAAEQSGHRLAYLGCALASLNGNRLWPLYNGKLQIAHVATEQELVDPLVNRAGSPKAGGGERTRTGIVMASAMIACLGGREDAKLALDGTRHASALQPSTIL